MCIFSKSLLSRDLHLVPEWLISDICTGSFERHNPSGDNAQKNVSYFLSISNSKTREDSR